MHYLLTVIGDTSNDVDDSAPGAIDTFNDSSRPTATGSSAAG